MAKAAKKNQTKNGGSSSRKGKNGNGGNAKEGVQESEKEIEAPLQGPRLIVCDWKFPPGRIVVTRTAIEVLLPEDMFQGASRNTVATYKRNLKRVVKQFGERPLSGTFRSGISRSNVSSILSAETAPLTESWRRQAMGHYSWTLRVETAGERLLRVLSRRPCG